MTAPDPAEAGVPAEAVDVDTLPPTQYLVMEVLAARYRLGETCWTFPTRLNATIMALGEAGLVWDVGGNVPQTTRVMLTDAGKRAVLLDGYEPPAHKVERAQILADDWDSRHRSWRAGTLIDAAGPHYAWFAECLRDTLAGDGGEAM